MANEVLTQPNWSHAALLVGSGWPGGAAGPEPLTLIEADLRAGGRAVPLSAYAHMHTRICRPVGLDTQEVEQVAGFVVGRLGQRYDLKNLLDLARYLLPAPPVPLGAGGHCRRERRHIRHHRLHAPRDFDMSPYFDVVKPTLQPGFDPHGLAWEDAPGSGPERR